MISTIHMRCIKGLNSNISSPNKKFLILMFCLMDYPPDHLSSKIGLGELSSCRSIWHHLSVRSAVSKLPGSDPLTSPLTHSHLLFLSPHSEESKNKMCITDAYNFFFCMYTHQLGHVIGIVVSVLEKPLTIIEKKYITYMI